VTLEELKASNTEAVRISSEYGRSNSAPKDVLTPNHQSGSSSPDMKEKRAKARKEAAVRCRVFAALHKAPETVSIEDEDYIAVVEHSISRADHNGLIKLAKLLDWPTRPPIANRRARIWHAWRSTDTRGHRRSNDTHESTTDPNARLYKKTYGKESKLSYLGHALVENRNGLIAAAMVTHADGYAERDAALLMLADKQ
jgi:hypothetical protein